MTDKKSTGAWEVHQSLLTNLKQYLIAQYFSKSSFLSKVVPPLLEKKEVLFQDPFVESTASYLTANRGIKGCEKLPDWLKNYFSEMASENLGVFTTPYIHQTQALDLAYEEKDYIVATGTGSGKTECFMWPILMKLIREAHEDVSAWNRRAVRVIALYPMNALVSDQLSRLRRLMGDHRGMYANLFKKYSSQQARRPQFGMYTGRTPYSGTKIIDANDKNLAETLEALLETEKSDPDFYKNLHKEGKIPAKANLKEFVERLKTNDPHKHRTDPDDAEMLTRFEMQRASPDILITNYSMLEYMLLRPIEQQMWAQTRAWLEESIDNKLLFVIDEAHMYRGASGGEVSLLLRRLMHHLNIGRDQIQFILTTASLPSDNDTEVKRFAANLTSGDIKNFEIIAGSKKIYSENVQNTIPSTVYADINLDLLTQSSEAQLQVLTEIFEPYRKAESKWDNLEQAQHWLYDNLPTFVEFQKLFNLSQGNAMSLEELGKAIFPSWDIDIQIKALNVLLAVAPLAKNEKGNLLFSARMHMLFRGINGVFACTNPNCPGGHTHDGISLGKIFLNNAPDVCPDCNHQVLELYNDRRCGALFFKAYAHKEHLQRKEGAFLWKHTGFQISDDLREIYFYIPPKGFKRSDKKVKNPLKICYLDTASGFINGYDDSWYDKIGTRLLYYSEFEDKGRPGVLTFGSCPHCQHRLQRKEVTSFSTKGNLPFYNLVRTQFLLQPPVFGKTDKTKYPNEGRKVLLFSDSRQQAAKLARDMSEYADNMVIRQLTMRAIHRMQAIGRDFTLEDLYGFTALEAAMADLTLFDGHDQTAFNEHAQKELSAFRRKQRRHKENEFEPNTTNFPDAYGIELLRFFCGPYNTLYDAAVCWLEPTENVLDDIFDDIEDKKLEASTEEELIELFNLWFISVCADCLALGPEIKHAVRDQVRLAYHHWGLETGKFLTDLKDQLKFSETKLVQYNDLFREHFLNIDDQTSQFFIELKKIRPRINDDHQWFRCNHCSELSPYLWQGACPHCGSSDVTAMDKSQMSLLNYWRKPLIKAIDRNYPISRIDVEEHTAQLSHKDQNQSLWSKTEEYELRFQDLTREDQTSVDILSCTTTMEVGIDIGSLVAVGLRNMPPMRENYQQRAGRAGRRGAALSTIVTFCEDGPHDTLYFKNPRSMVRGDARSPWIDAHNVTLIRRHLALVAIHDFLEKYGLNIDHIPAMDFIQEYLERFNEFLTSWNIDTQSVLLPPGVELDIVDSMKPKLRIGLRGIQQRCEKYPDLFSSTVTLLDVLYQSGLIPTYSFPKDVVATYIQNHKGEIVHQVERGLDLAINEYAPGRTIVVDKQTYQIGGIFQPTRKGGSQLKPANQFINDQNYCKPTYGCSACGWMGTGHFNENDPCPFCGQQTVEAMPPTLKPWGFAPLNGRSIPKVQVNEEYSSAGVPLYATLPNDDDRMDQIPGYEKLRFAERKQQQILLVNSGPKGKGFLICEDCGAAMPGDDYKAFDKYRKPFLGPKAGTCKHKPKQVNLGFDFLTDMLVLEIELDSDRMELSSENSLWRNRAAATLAEALRLTTCELLDIEFTELNSGYRFRHNKMGDFIDIYVYDNLSSGAGYAVALRERIDVLLNKTRKLLEGCTCESACFDCLKHYRNQKLHNLLDRKLGLALLDWAQSSTLPKELQIDRQWHLLQPLKSFFDGLGWRISQQSDGISCTNADGAQFEILVKPSMVKLSYQKGVITINEGLLRFALPYAADNLRLQLNQI